MFYDGRLSYFITWMCFYVKETLKSKRMEIKKACCSAVPANRFTSVDLLMQPT